MKWEIPPNIKIYEALGSIADGRVLSSGNTAKVYSSSKGKYYAVDYDPEKNEIMANDNGSYWKGYLGYPSIAFLMLRGKLKYEERFSRALAEIAWKDINTKFKNDFTKTEEYVIDILASHSIEAGEAKTYINEVQDQIRSLDVGMLGKRTKPPEGY